MGMSSERTFWKWWGRVWATLPEDFAKRGAEKWNSSWRRDIEVKRIFL